MAEKTIYMIRHGLIGSNINHIYSGRSDEALTESGAEQAEELARAIRGYGISVIYASPLRRTIQTAAILNEHIQGRLIEEPDLIEMDLGPWTGLSKKEVAGRFPEAYRTWVETPGSFQWDRIETLERIQGRVLRFLHRFKDATSDMIAAAVTHAVVVKCAFLYCNNLPLNSYHSIPAPNLSVHRLIFNNRGCGMEKVRPPESA
jgi:phosphoserine phosphatase